MLPLSLRDGFAAHKYLLVAIVECLQRKLPSRTTPSREQKGDAAVNRWTRKPSVDREHTPCVVMREHHDRGDISVADVSLERLRLSSESLTEWMRQRIAPCSQPDQDTLHLAMAPMLPGVPCLVHSIASGGESFTHMYFEGVWNLCQDDQFLLRAIRYAQLVATAIPLNCESKSEEIASTPSVPREEGDMVYDLTQIGDAYNHIAVHAALAELRQFRLDRARNTDVSLMT